MKTILLCIALALSIAIFQSCLKSTQNTTSEYEPDSTASYETSIDENIPDNRDANYYKERGYHVFTEANIAVRTPCSLNDVSSQASGDFLINYGGVENENDERTFSAYQLIVTRFPVGYNNFSEDKKQSFREEIFSSAIHGVDNYKRVKVGYEGYDGIIIESSKNGYSLKGETFIKGDFVYGLVVVSNDNLESRFNQYTNSIRFISESMEQEKALNQNEETIEYDGYSKYNANAFSIKYPESWEVIENPNQYACVAILEPQKGDNFRSNFNVVVSTQTRKLEDAFTNETVKQIKTIYPDYEPLSKEFITLNGIKCMKITSECTMEGYHVYQVQYFLKKGNTSYTVSFTIASRNRIKESATIENIINSLYIK